MHVSGLVGLAPPDLTPRTLTGVLGPCEQRLSSYVEAHRLARAEQASEGCPAFENCLQPLNSPSGARMKPMSKAGGGGGGSAGGGGGGGKQQGGGWSALMRNGRAPTGGAKSEFEQEPSQVRVRTDDVRLPAFSPRPCPLLLVALHQPCTRAHSLSALLLLLVPFASTDSSLSLQRMSRRWTRFAM